MTEAAFQECRKVMQKANYIRGLITVAKGEVSKWSKIADSHRENMNPGKADGADKMLNKAIAKLASQQKKFAEMDFPDPNLITEVKRCLECGKKLINNECEDCF